MWKAKAEEAKKLHEAAVRHGRESRILAEGFEAHPVEAEAKREYSPANSRWQFEVDQNCREVGKMERTFDVVCNVSTEVVEDVLDTVPDLRPIGMTMMITMVRACPGNLVKLRFGLQ